MNGVPASLAAYVNRGVVLSTGQFITNGECLRSRNGRFAALVASNGRFCLCLTATDGRIMREVASFPPGGRAEGRYFVIIQGDGNLVLYAGTGPGDNHGLLWSYTNAAAAGRDFFAMIEEDGNFSVARGLFSAPKPPPTMLWSSRSRMGIPPDLPPQTRRVGTRVGPKHNGIALQEFDTVTRTAPLGEAVMLQADDGRGVLDETEWRVTRYAECLWSYRQTTEVGRPMPFPQVGSGVARPIFGTRAGNYAFTMRYHWTNFRDRSGWEGFNGYFNVIVPAVTARVVNTSTVRVTQIGNTPYLQLGDHTAPATRGITLRTQVTAPAGCAGEIAAIQLIQSVRRYRMTADASWIPVTTNGNWVLDTSLPLSNRTWAIAGGGQTIMEPTDSPAAPLRAVANRLEVNESFRTYICFRPTESQTDRCWMPLARFDWGWQANIERLPNGQWGLPTAVAQPTPATVVFLDDPGAAPAWEANVRAIADAVQFPQGGPPQDIPPEGNWIRRNVSARCFVGFLAGLGANISNLLVLVGKFNVSNGTVVGWTSQEDLQAVRGIGDLSFLRELPAQERCVYPKTARQQQVIAAATKFDLEIAPQCFFGPGAEDQAIVKEVAPFDLRQMMDELGRIARQNGITYIDTMRLDHARMRVSFASPVPYSLLLALAAHPQVKYLGVAPEFRFDEPTTNTATS